MKEFTGNTLKLIALITMIIDHFGFYFSSMLNYDIYIVCRMIGRVSLPIFIFLLVQGFLYTKKFNKYIFNITIFATITQIILIVLDYLCEKNFQINFHISSSLNILFSFTILLMTLKLLQKTANKFKKHIGVIVVLVAGVGIVLKFIYDSIAFDYGYNTIVVGITLYILEILIQKHKFERMSVIYFLFSSLTIATLLMVNKIEIFALASIPIFLLYNGKRNSRNNNIKKSFFYIMFPLQHFALYIVSALICYAYRI